jgi:hypothetical protein
MISDAKRGGHNIASAADEKLDLVTPLHPLLHARAFYEAAKRLKVPEQVLGRLQLESGGEDMPDAYNWCPVTPGDLCVNVQGLFNPHEGTWMYQEFWGNLFGFINAVINFNRVPRFMQAVARRWLAIMLGMYFDDASIQDINSGQGQAQLGVRALFKLVGFKFNPEKSSRMQAEQDFAGVIHNFRDCLSKGSVPVRIRGRIVEKAQSLMQLAVGTDSCPPGLASKIRGMNQAMFNGFFGKVGRAAFGPLIQRKYSDVAP